MLGREVNIDPLAAFGQIASEHARPAELQFSAHNAVRGVWRCHRSARSCAIGGIAVRVAQCEQGLHFTHAVQASERRADRRSPFDDAVETGVKAGVPTEADRRQVSAMFEETVEHVVAAIHAGGVFGPNQPSGSAQFEISHDHTTSCGHCGHQRTEAERAAQRHDRHHRVVGPITQQRCSINRVIGN